MTFFELENELSIMLNGNKFEADYIICEIFDLSRTAIAAISSQNAPPELLEKCRRAARRRMENEPLQYIFERAYFLNLELKVSPAVLIPRPETEILAELAAKMTPKNGEVLEIGVGSGAISLGMFDLRRDLKITGVDISTDALEIAEENRKKYDFNVRFFKSNLFSDVQGKFDLIVANLPYVTEEEYRECPLEVRNFEPKTALTAPENGTLLLKKTINAAPGFLKNGGVIMLEIGESQSEIVESFMQGWFTDVKTVTDYNQRPRIVSGIVKNL